SELFRYGTLVNESECCWVWALEGGSGARNPFGVQRWKAPGTSSELAQLWHRGTVRKHPVKVDEVDVGLLHACYEAPLEASKLSSDWARRALKLCFYGILLRADDEFQLGIPALSDSSHGAVLETVRRVSRDLVTRAALPAMKQADELFRLYMPVEKPSI